MSSILRNRNSLDLRAPVFTTVRKGLWWLRLVTLLSVDSTLLYIAWQISRVYVDPISLPAYSSFNSSLIVITILMQIGVMAIQGLYRPGKKRQDYWNIIKTISFAHGLVLLTLFFLGKLSSIDRHSFLVSWLVSIGLIGIGRFTVNTVLEYLRQKKLLGRQSVYVICNPDEQDQALHFLRKENRYIISGTASANALDKACREQTIENINQLGVTEVFVSWDAIKNRMFVCWLFQAAGITIHILPMDLKPIYRELEITKIGGMPCLSIYCPLITGKDYWLKRSFDFCFSALFLALTFPIYIAIAILIKLDSPGPVFYKQTRVGLHEKSFQVWKFRTMVTNAEQLQQQLEQFNESKDGILFKIKDDPRITRIGKFLRRYSLDELPQIFNILRGEMSLIGPRPLPIRDVDKFTERHFIRQEVLPGVTGLWQVSGRSDITDFEQVIQLDLTYIENWSFWLDVQILWKTVQVVLKAKGAY
ncbi:MAG TPA: sugar transferase [Nostocaceae cyanobacterium]|nr:sugar transferase [Nostocaceae cyanobacterium]